jgi:hypothetical protein
MDQCSNRHAIPPAVTINPSNQPAHDLVLGLKTPQQTVLTSQRLRTIIINQTTTVESH